MKKTAIETAIAAMEKQKDILQNHFEPGKWNDDRRSQIDNCIEILTFLLPQERQDIIDAFYKGRITHVDHEIQDFVPKPITANDYFNQTFKQ